ncbi:MAG: SARP family transcriptional regulator [Hamadaea sp.]|nr:SARP family transcriptional regulator [Hamadaea sp.]
MAPHSDPAGAAVQVRLLGPVDVRVGARLRPVPGIRRTAALAALALHAGRIVPHDLLVEAVWNGAPPPTHRNALQNHVSYLRSHLGSRDAIVSGSGGFRLHLGAAATDVVEVEELLARARAADVPQARVTLLRAALRRWRDVPLVELYTTPWFDRHRDRLERLRATVQADLADARLAAGDHEAILPELVEQAVTTPLDEHIHRRLMLALYRSGRQTDALSVYQRLRETLDVELGVEPAPAVRALHTAILRQDPALVVVPVR